MLDKLEDMAAGFGHVFGYGAVSDLSNLADKVPDDQYILFHNGYFLANLNLDAQGALEYRHQLALTIAIHSKIHGTPADHRAFLLGLEIEMRRVFKALTKLGQVSSARAILGVSIRETTRHLDAINLTLTLFPDALSLCQL